MPDLRFAIDAMEPVSDGRPALNARLRITNSRVDERVQSIALRCQINIEPARRRYSVEEKEALADLFGSPERWATTVRPLVWTNAQVEVPAFVGSITVDVLVSCSFDLNIRAAKYLHALRDGEVPVSFLFSGTVFYEPSCGPMQIAQIPWEREAAFRVPVSVCKEVLRNARVDSAWQKMDRVVQEHLERCRAVAAAESDKA